MALYSQSGFNAGGRIRFNYSRTDNNIPGGLATVGGGSIDTVPPTRARSDSEVLVGPEGDQGLISPHVLQYNPKSSTFTTSTLSQQRFCMPYISPEYKLQEQQSFLATSVDRAEHSVALETTADDREDVKMHRLHTESLAMKGNRSCTVIEEDEVEIFSMQMEMESRSHEHPLHVHAASPSPESYVICTTKSRSETTYSSESQGSTTSSNEDDITPHHSPATRDTHQWPSDSQDLTGSCISTSPRYKSLAKRREGKVWPDSLSPISVGNISPKFIGRTKPVPPPKRCTSNDNFDNYSPLSFSPSLTFSPSADVSPAPSSQSSPLSSSPSSSHKKFLSSRSVSSSELVASLGSQYSKAFTFHDCKAGEESGRFNVDYFGEKEVDEYVKSMNTITKQLMTEQRPREMVMYVSSEKIRLAPPNSATLYKSFAIKDVLWARKCSKNKHIVGIVIWKSTALKPCCHILRCRDNVMAKTLVDTLWEQTQKVDEVDPSSCKVIYVMLIRPVQL